jgi:hypothetical protein
MTARRANNTASGLTTRMNHGVETLESWHLSFPTPYTSLSSVTKQVQQRNAVFRFQTTPLESSGIGADIEICKPRSLEVFCQYQEP